jgi:hypothetical protein
VEDAGGMGRGGFGGDVGLEGEGGGGYGLYHGGKLWGGVWRIGLYCLFVSFRFTLFGEIVVSLVVAVQSYI